MEPVEDLNDPNAGENGSDDNRLKAALCTMLMDNV